MNPLQGILADFVEKSTEQLSHVEAQLMDLEVQRVNGSELPQSQIDSIFRTFHTVKGTAVFLDLDNLVAVTHEAENLLDRIRQDPSVMTGDHVTVLCAALDFANEAMGYIQQNGTDQGMESRADDVVAIVQGVDGEQIAPELHLLTPDLIADDVPIEEDATPADVFPLDEAPPPTPEPVAEHASSHEDEEDEETETPEPVAKATPSRPSPASRSRADRGGGSIRVDVNKLDLLMNLVGELILAETMVTHNQDLENLQLQNFTKAARDLNRITRALQDIAMSVRMVPIGATFQRMHRLVSDVSLKQGKQVELVLAGETTEIDKNLVERIADPLVHMIRNAVDHGIESPADRLAAGKSERGTIKLEALHQSGEVWVVIEDDGGGLKKDRIVDRAIERGLIESANGMTDSEIFQLIFSPGFSTAETISEVSGRGVGMDVVRRNIEEVSGRVDVESKPGHGTRVTLKIPLTLAIIDGMLIDVAGNIYTLPLLNIKESLRGQKAFLNRLPNGDEVVNIRGAVQPLLRMRQLFEPGSPKLELDEGILVVCSHAGRNVCLLVDRLLGQRQTVIKGLPDYLGNKRSFSGCSILSNGAISLIIDLGALTRLARRRSAA